MAVSLEKLLEDIGNDDEDMVVLALRTLKRVRGPAFSNEPAVSARIVSTLERLAEDGTDEVRFFARDCLEYVKEHLPAGVIDATAGGRSGTSEAPSVAGRGGPEQAPQSGTALPGRDKLVQFLSRGVADPQKASAALAALRRVAGPEDLGLVRKYLRHSSPAVRRQAVLTISASGDERSILESLFPYLNDPSEDVRVAVLGAFKGIERKKLISILAGMLRTDKINVKVAAIYILAHLQGAEVVRLLALAARDGNEEVRSRVVDALQGRRGRDVLIILKGLVNDMDIDVADKALKIYEKLKIEEGVLNSSTELGEVMMEKLREISMSDGGPDESAEHDVPVDFPVDPSRRIAIDEQPAGGEVLSEYVVPKKPDTRTPGISQQAPADSGGPEEEAPSFKSLSEYPEEIQRMTEEVYDQIDDLLEEMGRTIWKLEKADRISDKRFSKLNYDIQRYEDMLEKRRREQQKTAGGFFSRLSAGNRRLQEKQQLNLEFTLSELYRRLGEVAVELSLSEDSRFPELKTYYSKVDKLLEEVRKIKEMHDL